MIYPPFDYAPAKPDRNAFHCGIKRRDAAIRRDRR